MVRVDTLAYRPISRVQMRLPPQHKSLSRRSDRSNRPTQVRRSFAMPAAWRRHHSSLKLHPRPIATENAPACACLKTRCRSSPAASFRHPSTKPELGRLRDRSRFRQSSSGVKSFRPAWLLRKHCQGMLSAGDDCPAIRRLHGPIYQTIRQNPSG